MRSTVSSHWRNASSCSVSAATTATGPGSWDATSCPVVTSATPIRAEKMALRGILSSGRCAFRSVNRCCCSWSRVLIVLVITCWEYCVEALVVFRGIPLWARLRPSIDRSFAQPTLTQRGQTCVPQRFGGPPCLVVEVLAVPPLIGTKRAAVWFIPAQTGEGDRARRKPTNDSRATQIGNRTMRGNRERVGGTPGRPCTSSSSRCPRSSVQDQVLTPSPCRAKVIGVRPGSASAFGYAPGVLFSGVPAGTSPRVRNSPRRRGSGQQSPGRAKPRSRPRSLPSSSSSSMVPHSVPPTGVLRSRSTPSRERRDRSVSRGRRP